MKVFTVDKPPLPLLVDECLLIRMSAYMNVHSTKHSLKESNIVYRSLFIYFVCETKNLHNVYHAAAKCHFALKLNSDRNSCG